MPVRNPPRNILRLGGNLAGNFPSPQVTGVQGPYSVLGSDLTFSAGQNHLIIVATGTNDGGWGLSIRGQDGNGTNGGVGYPGGGILLQPGGGAFVSGSDVGGDGGTLSLLGNGGGWSASGFGGLGGGVNLLGGTGGNATAAGTGGPGGLTTITGGNGGPASGGGTPGPGGILGLRAGAGGSFNGIGAPANGADLTLDAGEGSYDTNLSQVTGAYGSVYIGSNGANAIQLGWGSNTGSLRLYKFTGGVGGAAELLGGVGSAFGDAGGDVLVRGGDGNFSQGDGGDVIIRGGLKTGIPNANGSVLIGQTNTDEITLGASGNLVACGANVTGANLNTLTGGSNADALHDHNASNVAYTITTDGAAWNGAPATVEAAIARLANAVAGLLGGPIP